MSRYGFDESNKSYNLRTFSVMAKAFELKFFIDHPNPKPEEVEDFFWRLITDPDDDECDFSVWRLM